MKTFPNLARKKYRKKFKPPKIAKEENLILVPFVLDGVIAENQKTSLNQNGIHTAEGHRILAKNLIPFFVQKILKWGQ